MIETGSRERPGDDGAAQEDVLQRLERPVVDRLLAPARQRVDVALEMEVHLRDVFAHDLDLAYIPAAETGFVRETDVAEAQWIESHHLRGHSVDRYLVRAGE